MSQGHDAVKVPLELGYGYRRRQSTYLNIGERRVALPELSSNHGVELQHLDADVWPDHTAL